MTRSGVLGTLLSARCSKGSTTIRTATAKAINSASLSGSALYLGTERACLVGSEQPHLAREEGKLLHGELD